MNIKENLSDFLYSKKYFISYYDNNLYVYHFKDISKITDKQIIINIDDFNTIINGNDLKIIEFMKDELLIKGNINNVIKK